MVTRANAIKIQQLNKQWRFVSRADIRAASLGDTNGVVWVSAGLVNVRYTASGNNTDGLGWPTVVKMEVNIPDEPGTPVIVGLDEEYEHAVLKTFSNGVLQAGGSPSGGVTGNNSLRRTDLEQVPYLKTVPVGPSAPLYLYTMVFQYIRGKTYHGFTAALTDMSSYIPGTSGIRKAIGVFLKPDDTIEIVQGDNEYIADPIIIGTSLQPILNRATVGSIPTSFWNLYYGQTEIADTDRLLDARQWINIPDYDAATVTTTNNTQTTLASISVSELQMITITATINGRKSDYSAAIGGTVTATVRRATGGNVTLVGSAVVSSNEDSSGTPSFTIDVDTGTQTARLRVTGISAETWYWTAQYKQVVS